MCQEAPCHHQWLGGHWGFLTKDMEDMGHLWPHNCFWHWTSDVCTKFQLSSMIKSVSRTPCPWWEYLEDVESSWQETWRTGSSLTSWMYLVETKDHILKVSCQYLHCWPSCHKIWNWMNNAVMLIQFLFCKTSESLNGGSPSLLPIFYLGGGWGGRFLLNIRIGWDNQ